MVEYESFDDVLKELSIDENELKRLVSEGVLRAYRDEDRMKFRKEDIEALKRGNLGDVGSQPTLASVSEINIDENDGLQVVEETDETLLDIGDLSEDVDFEDTGATSVPTVELDIGGDTADATLTDELVFDDGEAMIGDADQTLAMDDQLTLDDGDLGLSTEPIGGGAADATVVDPGDDLYVGGGDDITLGSDELDLDSALGDVTEVGGMTSIGGAPPYGMAPPPMLAPQIQIQEKIKYVEILPSEKWGTKVVSSLTAVFLLLVLVGSIGVAAREDFLGLASFGYSIFKSGPMGNNSETASLGLYPISSSGGPVEVSSAEYLKPEHWRVTASESDTGAVMAPGMQLIRNASGSAPENDKGFATPAYRITREQMRDEAKTTPLPPDFRRIPPKGSGS